MPILVENEREKRVSIWYFDQLLGKNSTSTLRFFERTSRQKEGKGGIARTARQTKNEEATRQAWRAEYGNSQLIRGRPPCLKYRQFLRF